MPGKLLLLRNCGSSRSFEPTCTTRCFLLPTKKAKPRRRLVGDRLRPLVRERELVVIALSDAFQDFEDSDDAHLEGSEVRRTKKAIL
jgi:hypothetical protein